MKTLARLSALLLVALAVGTSTQRCWAEDDADLPDSPSYVAATLSPIGQVDGHFQMAAAMSQDAHPDARQITWVGIPKAFLKDQADIWLKFPGRMAKGHYWIPVLAVTGVTAGLIVADPHAMPYFRKHARNWDDFNDTFDAPITTGEVVLMPVGLLAAGLARNDPYQVQTAMLSGVSYADSAIVDLAIKAITHRQRPHEAPDDFHNTFFSGTTSPLKGSSFPSGHAAGAFAIATVIAGRYPNHKWVAPAVYSFATLISLSRITDSSHFPSDVFLGATLGYTVAKFQVLRPQ